MTTTILSYTMNLVSAYTNMGFTATTQESGQTVVIQLSRSIQPDYNIIVDFMNKELYVLSIEDNNRVHYIEFEAIT